eukprot:gene15164-15306_t
MKQTPRRQTTENLSNAVHRAEKMSKSGLLERAFTFAFRGLVYPQIWEDPLIDMEAMQIEPGQHIVAIASGGCNVMSYLVADPGKITAVDLNGAHIELNKLKLAAVTHFPDSKMFHRFLANAADKENISAYKTWLRPHLDESGRKYWDGRNIFGRRRIELFARNLYAHGLLGNFIGLTHWLGRLYGRDPRKMLTAQTHAQQRDIFETYLAPIFDEKFVRWLVNQPASLFGLGIPPAQYYALAGSTPGGITEVLRARLERLACDFDIRDNYFAAQAFGRSYAKTSNASLPPYLQSDNFEAVRARADRVEVLHQSFTVYLAGSKDGSLDRYVLLDAQDWMNDADLTDLWREITRTAKPGARVIFRTAAEATLLPGRVPAEILDRWSYDAAACRAMTLRDRSSIYGGFHLYILKDPS